MKRRDVYIFPPILEWTNRLTLNVVLVGRWGTALAKELLSPRLSSPMMNTGQFSYEKVTTLRRRAGVPFDVYEIGKIEMRFLTNWRKKRNQPEPLPEVSEYFIAIFEGDTEFVRLSLAQGANANEDSPVGRSALYEALLHEHTDIACLLLSYGAHPDGGSEISNTPLGLAVGNQDIISIRALLEHGADVNHGADANGSVLHKAVMGGNVEIVQLLLDYQVNLDLMDEDGETALAYTRAYWDHMEPETRDEIVRLLERAGTREVIE